MTCAAHPAGEPLPPVTVLRALLDLYNELRRAPDTAGRHNHLTWLRAGTVMASIDTTADERDGSDPTSSSGPRAGNAGPAAGGRGGPVDEQHADSWNLVEQAQGGDGEAFGKLYDRYVDTVYRFVFFRVNDRALAEDITSETFLRALRRISSFSYQGRDIGAWFVTIARNIVLDNAKSARARLEFSTADTIETREAQPSTEAAVLATLDYERLMRAVGELGQEQRECVMLRFVHGMSVSETASIMGKKDGAVKALQHRAVRRLAGLIKDDLDQQDT